MNINVPMLRPKAQRIITVRASYLFIMGEVKIVRAPQTKNVVLLKIAISFAEISRSCYIYRSAGPKAPVSALMKKTVAITVIKMNRRKTRGTSERSLASVRFTEETVSASISLLCLPCSTFADLFFIIRRSSFEPYKC